MKFEKVRVLHAEDLAALIDFEDRLKGNDTDPLGFLKSWSAPWRQESLEYYMSLGWSLGFFEEGCLEGYLLAQPLLFFRGQTQTLWVECVRGMSMEIQRTLLESAIKIAKEKHIQQVVFHTESVQGFQSILNEHNINFDQGFLYIKTTKWSESL